ncbi:MAG: hypothetical protein AAB780_00100 [Patescibacteria group bacterium]
MALLLNLPYSLVGLVLAAISLPVSMETRSIPPSLIIKVKNFWWAFAYFKNARAMAIGNVVLLSPKTEVGDLEHELVHVEQHQRAPLIQPFLYSWELFKNGYRNNKYEKEAYERAGNTYKG